MRSMYQILENWLLLWLLFEQEYPDCLYLLSPRLENFQPRLVPQANSCCPVANSGR